MYNALTVQKPIRQRKRSQSEKKQKKIWQTLFLSVFAFGVVGMVTVEGSPTALAACTYPSQVLNLTNWKQTLPIGSSGSPTEIKQSKLAAYALSPYFSPNTGCDGVVFRAPVNGVTTSGSGYPRSELREMTKDGSANASWSTTSGTHTMIIDQAILAVPKAKKHVVAGQIHDASDDVIVIRLEYPKLFVDINGNTGPTLDANYVLGKRFTVKFEASNGKIKVYYNGGATPVYTLDKKSSGNYFKAGAYTQSNCSKEKVCDSSNYGEVAIYNLLVKHGDGTAPVAFPVPTPTPEPAPAPAPTTPDPTPTPTPAPVVSGLSFEAESGKVTEPMKIFSDISALGGQYIVQTADEGTGSAQYSVAIPDTGKYQLKVRAIAPNGSSNSIYYSVDSNSSNAWHLSDDLSNWTWVGGPTLALSRGTHTFTVKKREAGTKIDAFELLALGTGSAEPPFEAESGTVSGGMKIQSDDTTASGGKYVEATASGAVSYQVNVPVTGTYRVAGWIKAASGSSDSFSLAVDNSSTGTWTLVSPSAEWTYDIDDGHTYTLSAGMHTIKLSYREAGAKIDKLVLVKQ